MGARLVIDARGLGLGHRTRGIGRVIVELLGALDPNGRDVEVRGPEGIEARFPRLQCRPVHVRAWRDVLTPGPFDDADVLLRLAPTAPGPLDRRSVVCCYDVIPLKAPAAHFPMHRRLRYPLSWSLYRHTLDTYRNAGLVWTISQAVGDDVTRLLGVSPARVRAIPLAAPAWARVPHVGDRVQVRQRFGLPGPFILWVLGGPNENKNVDGMFRVAAHAGNRIPRLCIVGGLDLHSQASVHASAARAGAPPPTLLGRVDDEALRALLAAASCVVVPSRDEGFGMPVIEALACGGSVAANDIPALREAGGSRAVYGNVEEPTDFIRAIESAIAQPRQSDEGSRRTWGDVADAVIASMDELAFR